MLQMNIPKIGLYRHFKGSYYFLMNMLRSDEEYPLVQYVNVLHPELGYFCRPYPEWNDDVSSREDNVTGQIHRFELVKDLDNSVKNISTELFAPDRYLEKIQYLYGPI